MTEPTRTPRPRRGGRRPGWVLLTVLLVLAIGASSALVFTNKVELLKLAVILALWAAVVAAFVSVIYRRQSDADQAKVRDLKLVYDLQLDREISARREYELSVETQLRRELVSELRAQAADEVAGLRAELAALRANLEILFDADLSDRPAIETDRSTVRAYSDWARDPETTGRVTSSRIDYPEDAMTRTDESPIIDVPEEPQPPEYDSVPGPIAGGAHRRSSEMERGGRRRRDEPRDWSPPPPPRPVPPPAPRPQPEPAQREDEIAWTPPPPEPPKPAEPAPPRQAERVTWNVSTEWQPAPADGAWIPAGAPGSNWTAPNEVAPQPAPAMENGSAGEYVGRRRAQEPGAEAPDEPQPPPPSQQAQAEPPSHPAPAEPPSHPAMSTAGADARRGRHSAPADAVDPGRPSHPPPALATEPAAPPPHPEPESTPAAGARHRSEDDEPQTGGQSVAELLARLQATPSGGGRRRRRDE